MQAILNTLERLLIWPLMACALAIAGYQAGILGSNLVYPNVSEQDADPATPKDFVSLVTGTNAQWSDVVAPLFGVPQVKAAAPRKEEPEIAQNTLYHLQGITVTGSQRWAMLTSGGASWLVRPGDTLESSETVREITNQSVLLDAGGTLTILRFSRTSQETKLATKSSDTAVMADFNPEPAEPDTPKVTRVSPALTPAPTVKPMDQAQPALSLQALRRALYAPDALSAVRFQRARLGDGNIGWRLKWIADSPLVKAAGLQRGDVLRAINGVEISNATGLQNLITTVAKVEEIVILFERKTVPMRSIIPLDQNR